MVHARYPAPPADYGYDPSFAYDDVVPAERIGPPLPSRSGRIVRGGLALLAILNGGWFLLQHQDEVPRWTSAAMEAVSQLTASTSEPVAAAPPPLAERRLAPPPFVPVAPRAMPPVEEHPPMATPVVAPAEAPSAAETPAPAVTASLPPSAVAKEAPQPLEQVKANPADPLQVRAEAAGLHPGLSRVLLESLTAEDYRNAGYAVRTALAQTPDSAVFVWPRKQTAGQAVFKVHFVAGAETDCRRYVVTVIKNRWATTARPMEKCGVPQPAQHRVTSNRPRQ